MSAKPVAKSDAETPPMPGMDEFVTPGDDAVDRPRKRVPARGRRKRVLGSGEGDYEIRVIAPAGGEIPAGALLPIPDIPRFTSTEEAMRWIRNEGGERLVGNQVAVIRFTEIVTIQERVRPQIEVVTKPKIVVREPVPEADGDADGV